MDELLQDFLTETTENLASIDNDLVSFEQRPDGPDLIRNIFRAVHTIKGTCGFIGLVRLGQVAHAAENVLGLFRDGKLQASADTIGTVLASIDRMKLIINGTAEQGAEPQGDDSDLIAHLNAIIEGDAAPAVAAAPTETAVTPAKKAKKSKAKMAEPVAAAPVDDEPIFEPVPAFVAEPAPAAATAHAAVAAAAIVEEVDAAPKDDNRAANVSGAAAAAQTVRVSIPLLESLMTAVSELVLTRNQLVQGIRDLEIGSVKVPLQRLSQIVSELQEGVMKTRMQPIGNAWQKLPRLIRDLSHELDKKIDLQLSGAETEVDRQVLEIIKDPLTHMIRNSADHGLETPAERVAAGKNEIGKIFVSACHESGHIVIVIEDDGRGLNTARIREKIVEKGLLGAAAAAQLSAQQVHRYIFDAGFSTAAKITAVSGRGVGMDVVRSNIEKIGGAIELLSTENKGTKFVIRIPLTLAIADALIVETGGERFALPQLAVLELVMVSPNSEHRLERVNGADLLRLRDRLLPVLHLDSVLDIASKSDGERYYVLILQAGGQKFGLAVDRVLDTEEIVIKPVAPILKDLPIYAGSTILGDGRVVMILDTNGLAARISSATADKARADDEKTVSVAQTDAALERVLVFEAGANGPLCAVALEKVDRIENLHLDKVESGGDRAVVQYRGSLMPLETIDYTSGPLPDHGTRPTLVFNAPRGPFGIIVERIVDVVEADITPRIGKQRGEFLGTAVIAGKATEIVDIDQFANRAWPETAVGYANPFATAA
ncbi:MAG TPA: chemotaxis protein CheA [Stellaceae bacterium]|jgi:two-component system chemotaxis sensor kinase CheA|nr:chemotaxis protein CheA [Stellaceae bacterium]